jgi:mannose-6-phosphate isomerase-like protein (cupin superfamily)
VRPLSLSALSCRRAYVLQRLNRQEEDSLSKLLRVANVHGTVYCLSDFRAPWGFHVEDSAVAKFHMTLEGRCALELDSGERLNLEPGGLVVLPIGSGHTVRNRFSTTSVPAIDSILAANPPALGRLRYGARGRRTRLLCGGFSLTDVLPARLLAVLPRIVMLEAERVASSGVAYLIEVLRAEADDA